MMHKLLPHALLTCLVACSSQPGTVRAPSDASADKPTARGDGGAKADGVREVDGGTPRVNLKPAPLARRRHLQWKRAEVLEADLARALELPPEELCSEFGTVSCLRDVHLVPLGGYDTLASGMLEGAPDPIVTTPTAIERVLLSACTRRVERDMTSDSKSTIFAALDLSSPAASADPESLRAFVTTLYRRMLARDPSEQELTEIASLATGGVGSDELAKLACFTVGSLSEFIFF